ncbi:hypothetical protein A2V82_03075 [candidate division KSB1 bacterium RBG_16_48_16]|nr:MAG: hypothetical protein A2V82_03075 [candidate division KSB1 bacterium RBG_16_48_16]
MKIIKNVSLALLVVLLSAAIFFTFTKDKRLNDNVLDSTLGLLGDQLFAMVPDGEKKDALQKKYKEFLGSVDKDEVSPARIEKVAAAILNETSQDTIDADNIMATLEPQEPTISEVEKKDKQTGERGGIARFRTFPRIPRHVDGERSWSPQDYDKLAHQIQQVSDFHRDLLKELPKFKKEQHFVFKADSGLSIEFKPDVKTYMKIAQKNQLMQQFTELQKEQLLKVVTSPEAIQSMVASFASGNVDVALGQLEKNIETLMEGLEDKLDELEDLDPAESDTL